MTRIDDLLRDEFRRADPAVPTRDAMLARVRNARRRRAAGAAAVGGLALAAAVVAAASLVRPGSGGDPPVGGTEPARSHTVELLNTLFTDPEHGYVVQERCSLDVMGEEPSGGPTPDVHRECAWQLLVTADAGRTWQARPLPADPATKDAGVTLLRGHSLMLWIDDAGRLALGGNGGRYWTTTDGGTTWQQSPVPRATGPAGSLATFTAADRLAFLATPPPDAPPMPSEKDQIVPATDGSFWTRCGAGCVRVTHDQGATWQSLPTLDASADVQWVATADGRTVYACLRGGTGARVIRSTDAGATWTDLTTLRSPSGAALAMPNGDLLLTRTGDPAGLLRVRAGSTSPEDLTGAPAHLGLLYTTGGVTVATQTWDERDNPDLGSVVSVSPDGGTTWYAVPPPPA